MNVTEDSLGSQLSDNTVKLLQLKSLRFSMLPGYRFELDVRRNGALNVDVYASKCLLTWHRANREVFS